MKPLRTLTALCAALMIAFTTACDTAPTAPAPAPELSLIGDLTGTVTGVLGGVLKPVTGLLSCNVRQTYTTTRVIGRDGGTIRVGAHTLVIPRGALSSNKTITATAPKGDVVAVEFQPHGLQFAKPTILTMSYAECGLVKSVLKKLSPRIVYVDDNRNILETLISLPDLLRQTVTAKTDHFSSYMVAD
jgi:hypothetical protein